MGTITRSFANLITASGPSAVADGSIVNADINASAAIVASKLSGISSQPFRNIVINGDMQIAQRGTSTSSVSSGAGFDCVDRFSRYIDSAGTWTISQSTDVPSGYGFAKSMKFDCTTANGSLSSTSEFSFFTKFEGQNLQYLKKGTANAVSLTLSFWVKSTKTGTFTCELYDSVNSRAVGKTYTVSVSNTWEFKTVTFAGDTTGAFPNDNSAALNCTFFLVAGSAFTSGTFSNGTWQSATTANRVSPSQVNTADSTSNDFLITGIQLEAGTSATDFEFLPIDVSLERCQRYFQKSYDLATAPATNTNQGSLEMGLSSNGAGDVLTTISYKVSMRTTPTITYFTPSGTSGSWDFQRSGSSSTATMTAYSGRYGQNYSVSYLGSGSAFVAVSVIGHFKADAEL